MLRLLPLWNKKKELTKRTATAVNCPIVPGIVDGLDGREITDVTQPPYNQVGVITVIGSQGTQQCSAFVLGKWSMLTAAHCMDKIGKIKGGFLQLAFGRDALGNPKNPSPISIVAFKYQQFNGTVDTDYAAVFLQSPLSVPRLYRDHGFVLVPGVTRTEAIGYPEKFCGQRTNDQYNDYAKVFSQPAPTTVWVKNDMDHGNSGGPIRLPEELQQPVIGIASKFGTASYNRAHRLNLNNESQVNVWMQYQPAGQVAFINAPVNGAAYDIFSVPAFQARATAFGTGKAQAAGDVSSRVISKSALDGVLGNGAMLLGEIVATQARRVRIHS